MIQTLARVLALPFASLELLPPTTWGELAGIKDKLGGLLCLGVALTVAVCFCSVAICNALYDVAQATREQTAKIMNEEDDDE